MHRRSGTVFLAREWPESRSREGIAALGPGQSMAGMTADLHAFPVGLRYYGSSRANEFRKTF